MSLQQVNLTFVMVPMDSSPGEDERIASFEGHRQRILETNRLHKVKMALTRATNRGCLYQVLQSYNSLLPRTLSTTQCCVKSHMDTVGKAKYEMTGHWIKNEKIQRPISPHLTIWKWQLPMNTSLMHRVTGCAMTTALYVFGYTICLLPGDYITYLTMVKDWSLGPALITSAKFILAYPLAYHAINGARHLVSL
ncbi:SDHC [Bugula neritina]|uniref:SDHC n=1 Tax=Bugula neritina TaxID=10212 RepID=A0A7J7KJF3_BUGNE|nr:SDHC [Bugula neritina]